MSLWGNLDAANNAPVSSAMAGYGGATPQVTANSEVYYANTQLGSFTDNQAIGIFGVSAEEQAKIQIHPLAYDENFSFLMFSKNYPNVEAFVEKYDSGFEKIQKSGLYQTMVQDLYKGKYD